MKTTENFSKIKALLDSLVELKTCDPLKNTECSKTTHAEFERDANEDKAD